MESAPRGSSPVLGEHRYRDVGIIIEVAKPPADFPRFDLWIVIHINVVVPVHELVVERRTEDEEGN